MLPVQTPAGHSYWGLAPFLRHSIGHGDMGALARELLAAAQACPDNAALLMDVAIAMFCIQLNDLGHTIQKEALALTHHYGLPAHQQPARYRLLMLMAPGDLATNTPLECLLEKSDIQLDLFFLSSEQPCLDGLPDHDGLFVAIGEFDRHRSLLQWLDGALAAWPRPVFNRPGAIPGLARHLASQMLQGIPGLTMPPTHRLERSALLAVAAGHTSLPVVAPACRFPIILRPVGSQAGNDLARLESETELAEYLERVTAEHLYLSNFVDYRGPDGYFRKARIVLVDGRPFVAHMAVSTHWMVHYVNAGMYEQADRRREEGAFMADFPAFAARHRDALAGIWQRSGLDYLCIDCAETPSGELLVFEVGNAMVVHAMDDPALFPYKPAAIGLIVAAFREMLLQHAPLAHGLNEVTP